MLRALFVAGVASNALAARVKVEAASSVAHVMDKIGSLLEAHGADAKVLSNLKLFAGQRVTPGATDSFNEILTRVINEIEADVESKIKSGHADTQAEIDRRIGNVKSTTTVVVERKSEADANDKDWSDCVRAEKAARVAVEEAEAALANSRSNINEPCQLQDDRAPYEWTPNPEKLKFVCDISQSGNCDQQLTNYESQIGNMMAGLRSDVDAKVAAYTEAKQACDAAKADAVEKQDSRDAAVTAWEGKRTECEEKHEPRQVAICMFGAALQAKCEGVEAYRTLMAQIDQVKGGEYSHPDRVAEWKTTAMTKCLLSKVVDGADVNEATLGACEQSVNFDQDVGVLDRKSQLFAELTSPDKFTCAEKTIKFTGETWNVPEGDAPASSEYTKEPFHPEVSLASDSVPFALCRGGNNGGKDTEKPEPATPSCSGSTPIGSTQWINYGGNGIYVDVDTSACGFTATPAYITSLGGSSSQWTSTGSSEIYHASETKFRVYIYKSGITPAQANKWNWHMKWIAQQVGQRAHNNVVSCAGKTDAENTKWVKYGSSNGLYVDVDTSSCGHTEKPVYVTALAGRSNQWTSTGSSETYRETATGFRVYIRKSGITTEKAKGWNWHIDWISRSLVQPKTSAFSSCAGLTTKGNTNWVNYGNNGIYVDVDTSSCGFTDTDTPVYTSALGGDTRQWTSTGSSETYHATEKKFRVYIHKSGITPAQANSWNWHINWIAAGRT